jgi:uncharacterized protein YndB with AHSA1/START domain
MSSARPSDPFNLCKFTFANGRMCGLPAHPKHDGFCLTHARRSNPKPREDDLSAELAEHDGKTKLTLHARVTKAAPDVAGALAGMEQGWTESLERLAEFAAKP